MGVFLYANRPINSERVKDVFLSRGHKRINCYYYGNETIIHSGKTLVDNVGELGADELGGEEGDFILGIGTYFYKGSFGDEALKSIWSDIEVILEANTVYGHWAFVVRKSNTTYVVNDMSGVLRLYYVIDEDGIVITSSLVAAIASIEGPRFDRDRLSGFLASECANEIPFIKGVEIFNSWKYYKYNSQVGISWNSRKIELARRIEDTGEAVSYVRNLFKQQNEQLKPIKDEVVSVELTGGLDSRLTTSNLDTGHFKYDFIHYPLFGPDREVADVISIGEHKCMHIQTNIPIGERCFEHYGEFDFGFNYFRQYPNPRWVLKNKIQFSGALGECLSTPFCIDYLNRPIISDIVPQLVGSKLMKKECINGFRDSILCHFKSRGFNVDNILKEYELFGFEQLLLGQLCGDFMYNSGAQSQLYFYNFYTEWHFNHYVGNIAYNIKNSRALTIALIKAISPKYASYPFVSRRRTKRKSINGIDKLPLHYFSYNGIKKLLPKSVVDYVYNKIGRSFNKERLNAIDFEIYKDVVDVEEIKRHCNLYSNTLNRMYSVEVLRKIFNITW